MKKMGIAGMLIIAAMLTGCGTGGMSASTSGEGSTQAATSSAEQTAEGATNAAVTAAADITGATAAVATAADGTPVQAATSGEQPGGITGADFEALKQNYQQKVLDYVGTGFKAVSFEEWPSNEVNGLYRVGVTLNDNLSSPTWYYFVSDNSCMSEMDYYAKNADSAVAAVQDTTMTKEQWEDFTKTPQFQSDMSMQSAGYKVLDYVGEGYRIVSAEEMASNNPNGDYKIKIARLDDPASPTWTYVVTNDVVMTEADYYNSIGVTMPAEESETEAAQSGAFTQQDAIDKVMAYVGEGYVVESVAPVETEYDMDIYCVGVSIDDVNDYRVWYYFVGEGFCMSDTEWYGG